MDEEATGQVKSWVTREAWMEQVHRETQREPSCEFLGCCKALFPHGLVRRDCERLAHARSGRAIVEQLIRSAGSITANVKEGHGPPYGKQRSWFLIVCIGSARETRGCYWHARQLLSEDMLEHRLALADEVIALGHHELKGQRSRQGEADL